MMGFLSPDGEIGAPLQAAAFLAAIYLAVFLGLAMVIRTVRQRGLASAIGEVLRPPTLILIALIDLTALNLFHHVQAPLDGVFRPEVGDGGWVENLTIAAMLVLPLAFLARFAGWRPRRALGPVVMIIASVVLIIAFGEEVSWGQHWFGITPPAVIAETNLQAEINLHNYIAPSTMEAIYLAGAVILFALAVTFPMLMRATGSTSLLGLQILLLFCAVLMSHHIFQELAELAVIVTGVVIWSRMEAGQLELRPEWLQSVARI